MTCTQTRNAKQCPHKGKAINCSKRGPFVKPSGHTCRDLNVHQRAIRNEMEHDLHDALHDRGESNTQRPFPKE